MMRKSAIFTMAFVSAQPSSLFPDPLLLFPYPTYQPVDGNYLYMTSSDCDMETQSTQPL